MRFFWNARRPAGLERAKETCMKKRDHANPNAAYLDELIEEITVDANGNDRRGLTAIGRGSDGAKHAVAACDVVIAPSTRSGRYLAAYRKWMGLTPFLPGTRGRTGLQTGDLTVELDGPVELVVLSVKQKTARCRLLGGDR